MREHGEHAVTAVAEAARTLVRIEGDAALARPLLDVRAVLV